MLEKKTKGQSRMDGQSTETGNIVYTRHRTKTKKKQHRKLKKMSNTDTAKNTGGKPRCPRKISSFCIL